jgi:hypothetical protein
LHIPDITLGPGGRSRPTTTTGKDHLRRFGTTCRIVIAAPQANCSYSHISRPSQAKIKQKAKYAIGAHRRIERGDADLQRTSIPGPVKALPAGMVYDWVAGAGADAIFTERWSIKSEWLRADLGSVPNAGAISGP